MMRWRLPPFLIRSFFNLAQQLRSLPTAYEAKLAAHKPPPVLLETDIEENFIKGASTPFMLIAGFGPGGQKINKTSSCVQLKHIPTGITVKCQETRSRDENRKIARRILTRKLDVLENGEESLVEIKKWKAIRRKKDREKKSKRKYRRLEEEKNSQEKAEENVEE